MKSLKTLAILLAIFTFFSLKMAASARAALPQVESVFEVLTNKDVHLGNWAFNAGGSVFLNAGIKMSCGGEKDMDSVLIRKEPCLTDDELKNMLAYMESGRMPGGLFALSTFTLNKVISEPTIPTNLAMYFDDVRSNTIFNTSAYAAPAAGYSEPTQFFQATTLGVWKVTRNLSLAMLGLFLAIAALGVLFRQKLSPQAVVTIYSILPSVPLAILFIVLSYPIVAVAMNLAGPLMSLAVKLGMDVFQQFAQNVNLVFNPIIGSTIASVLLATMAGVLNPVTLAVISFPIAIILISMVFLLVVLIIKAVYEFAKYYGTFVILTIGFPVAAVVSILPGKQGVLMFFIKKLLVNMLVFPVGIFLVYVGFGFIATVFDSGLGFGAGGWEYILFAGIFVAMVKFSIGFGIVWNGFKIRGVLENALGVGGSVMSGFSGGAEDPKKRR